MGLTTEHFKKIKPEFAHLEGDELWDAMEKYALEQREAFQKGEQTGRWSDLGPTGKFPDGSLGDTDGGELTIGVTIFEGNMIIGFGQPTSWIGLNKDKAIEFAEGILRKAQEMP